MAVLKIFTVLLLQMAIVDSLDVICYYTNWAQYRPQDGRYTVQNIDPNACTHVIFAFAKLTGPSYTVISPYEYNDEAAWKQLNDLKNRNSNLKTLLAIGGFTLGSTPFSTMTEKKESRQQFIANIISLLRSRRFDGLDLDWEYPAVNKAADKQNLALLLRELRESFDNEGARTSRPPLLLSMAVAAGIEKAKKAYDVPVMESTLDMLNIMTYDYHGSWDPVTGLATPLNSIDDLSVMKTVDWYMCQGASRQKIRLGLALYGRTWGLRTPGDNRVGAPAIGAGMPGPYTRERGFVSMYEICQQSYRPNEVRMDSLGQVNHATRGNQFVTYENLTTLSIKLNYIREKGLHGAMIWALDLDDFNSRYCGQSYVKYVYDHIYSIRPESLPSPPLPTCPNGHVATPAPTPVPTPRTTQRPTTHYVRPTQAPTQRPTTHYVRPTQAPTQRPTTHYVRPTQAPTQRPTAATPTFTVTNGRRKGRYFRGVSTCNTQSGYFADPSSCHHYYFCISGLAMRGSCVPHNRVFDPQILKCGDFRCQ